MNDFQSFLFQNMQLSGWDESKSDESEKQQLQPTQNISINNKTNNNSASSFSLANSNNNINNKLNKIINKRLDSSTTASTTTTTTITSTASNTTHTTGSSIHNTSILTFNTDLNEHFIKSENSNLNNDSNSNFEKFPKRNSIEPCKVKQSFVNLNNNNKKANTPPKKKIEIEDDSLNTFDFKLNKDLTKSNLVINSSLSKNQSCSSNFSVKRSSDTKSDISLNNNKNVDNDDLLSSSESLKNLEIDRSEKNNYISSPTRFQSKFKIKDNSFTDRKLNQSIRNERFEEKEFEQDKEENEYTISLQSPKIANYQKRLSNNQHTDEDQSYRDYLSKPNIRRRQQRRDKNTFDMESDEDVLANRYEQNRSENESDDSINSRKIASIRIKSEFQGEDGNFSLSKKFEVKVNNHTNYELADKKIDALSFRRKSRNLSSPESIKKLEFKSSTPIITSSSAAMDAARFRCSFVVANTNNNDYEREVKSPMPMRSNIKEIKKKDKMKKNMHCLFDLSQNSIHITSSADDLTDSNYHVKSTILNKKKTCSTNNHYIDSDEPSYDNDDILSIDCVEPPNIETYKKNKFNSNDDILSKKKTKNNSCKKNSNQRVDLNETDSGNSFESVLIQPILEKFEEELIKSSKTEIIKDLSNYNKFSLKKYLKDIHSFRLKKDKTQPEKNEKSEDKTLSLNQTENTNINKLTSEDIIKQTSKDIPWDNLEITSTQLLIKNSDKNDIGNLLDLYTKNGHKIKSSQIKKWSKIINDLKMVNTNDINRASHNNSNENNIESHKSLLNSESQKSIKLFKKDFLMNTKRQILDKVTKKTSKTLNEISNSCSEISRKSSKFYSNIMTDHNNNQNNKTSKKNKASIQSEVDDDCDAKEKNEEKKVESESRSKKILSLKLNNKGENLMNKESKNFTDNSKHNKSLNQSNNIIDLTKSILNENADIDETINNTVEIESTPSPIIPKRKKANNKSENSKEHFKEDPIKDTKESKIKKEIKEIKKEKTLIKEKDYLMERSLTNDNNSNYMNDEDLLNKNEPKVIRPQPPKSTNKSATNKIKINRELIAEPLNKITLPTPIHKDKDKEKEANKTKIPSDASILYDHFYNEIHENSFEQKQRISNRNEGRQHRSRNTTESSNTTSTTATTNISNNINNKNHNTSIISNNSNFNNNKTDENVLKSRPNAVKLNESLTSEVQKISISATSNNRSKTSSSNINNIENQKETRDPNLKEKQTMRKERKKNDQLLSSDRVEHQSKCSIDRPNSKMTKSNSTTSLVPSLPEFLDCKATNPNTTLKQPICSLAKLKSPERKILYNEWFTIIKKMEKDPKFDLETLVRTRGRFTEQERISYRNRLLIKQQKLRCARSEPNFGAMLFMSQTLDNNNHEVSRSKDCTMRRRNNVSPTTLRTDDKRKNALLLNGKNVKLKRNLSATLQDSTECNNTINSEFGFSERVGNLNKQNLLLQAKNDLKPVSSDSNTLSSPMKLTLQKSDINLIKEILKKKEKSVISDLTNLAFGNKNTKNPQIKLTPNSGANKIDTSELNSKKTGLKLKARASSDDKFSVDNSSLTNENENKFKLIKPESAKAFCDEFSKIIKGTIEKTQKSKKDSNTKTKESEVTIDNKNNKINKRQAQNSHQKEEKRNKKSSTTFSSSMSLNSEESIIDHLDNDQEDHNGIDQHFKHSKTVNKNKKKILKPNDDDDSNNNINSQEEIEIVSAKKSTQRSKTKNSDSFDLKIKDPGISKSFEVVEEKNHTENNRKNNIRLAIENKKTNTARKNATLSPPPRPAPPKRPPPPRPTSPKEIQKSTSSNNCEINKSKENMSRSKTQQLASNPQKSNLPPRPPLPPTKSNNKRFSDITQPKREEFASDSVIYDFEEQKKTNNCRTQISKNKNKTKITSSSSSHSSSPFSRSDSASPSTMPEPVRKKALNNSNNNKLKHK